MTTHMPISSTPHHRFSLLLLHNSNANPGVRWVLAARRVDSAWNRWVWTSWGTACLGVIARGVTMRTQMGVRVFLRWMSWIWGTSADWVVGAGWSVRIGWLSEVFRWGWRLWGIEGKVGVYTLFLVRSVKYVYQISVWLLGIWTFYCNY